MGRRKRLLSYGFGYKSTLHNGFACPEQTTRRGGFARRLLPRRIAQCSVVCFSGDRRRVVLFRFRFCLSRKWRLVADDPLAYLAICFRRNVGTIYFVGTGGFFLASLNGLRVCTLLRL